MMYLNFLKQQKKEDYLPTSKAICIFAKVLFKPHSISEKQQYAGKKNYL